MSTHSMTDCILIFDFGSQYTHLIKSKLLNMGIKAIIIPADIHLDDWKITDEYAPYDVKGIILSGGPSSVTEHAIDFDEHWLQINVPILGICYGYQLLAKYLGGNIINEATEYGKSKILVKNTNIIFKNIQNEFVAWMSHQDSVNYLPDSCEVIASSQYVEIAAFYNKSRELYGLLFHPEVSHTEFGEDILKNFSFEICKMQQDHYWNPQYFVEQSKHIIHSKVKNSPLIVAVSGGVDSLTMLALLQLTLDEQQLIAVYVDSGLMPDETEIEVRRFCSTRQINLIVLNESDRFFSALTSVIEPKQKCKVIGKVFIDILEDLAKKYGTKFVAQGTIWSDVIESGVTKFSSQIKPHHNVGGLPEELHIELLEPLRELFKNQVREVAQYLNLSTDVVQKKVFPGPGFAIRVQGEVTKQKVALVRQSTKIVEEVISGTPIERDLWMAFTILINVPSLGVKGDKHITNKYAIVVRAVESLNSMTANFSLNIIHYLKKISERIVNETNVGRVVYDITDKPPATIEWE